MSSKRYQYYWPDILVFATFIIVAIAIAIQIHFSYAILLAFWLIPTYVRYRISIRRQEEDGLLFNWTSHLWNLIASAAIIGIGEFLILGFAALAYWNADSFVRDAFQYFNRFYSTYF